MSRLAQEGHTRYLLVIMYETDRVVDDHRTFDPRPLCQSQSDGCIRTVCMFGVDNRYLQYNSKRMYPEVSRCGDESTGNFPRVLSKNLRANSLRVQRAMAMTMTLIIALVHHLRRCLARLSSSGFKRKTRSGQSKARFSTIQAVQFQANNACSSSCILRLL